MNEKVNPGKLLKSFNGTFGTTVDPMFTPTSLFPHGGCLQIVAYSKIMAQLSQGWTQRGEGASGFISGSNCCCCCFWHDAICCSSEEHRGPRYSLHPLPFLADSLVPRSPEPVMDRATCNELPNTQIRASGVWLLPSLCHCCSAYWGILIYIRGYDSLLRSECDVRLGTLPLMFTCILAVAETRKHTIHFLLTRLGRQTGRCQMRRLQLKPQLRSINWSLNWIFI